MATEAMRSEHGFTLLEVLIAFAIAALALGLMFRAASAGLISVETAGRYQDAVSRARSHMAAIGRDAPIAPGTTEGDDGGGFHWQIEVNRIAGGQSRSVGAIPGPPPPTLYTAIVRISWHDAGKDRAFVLRSERMGLGNAQ